MGRAQRSAIALAKEGAEHLFVGRVRAFADLLYSPLTKRPCVYFEVRVSTPDYDGGWQENVHYSDGVLFLLDDGSGECALVDLSLSWVVVTSRRVATPKDAFLVEHGIDRSTSLWGSSAGALRSHFEEGLLSDGDLVAVLGRGVREPDPDGAARAAVDRELPPMRLRIGGARWRRIVVCGAAFL